MSFGINYNTQSSGYYSLGSLCSAGIANNSGSLLDSLNVMTTANSADSGSKNTVVYTPVVPTVGSIDSAGTINSANSICVGNTGKVGSSDSASSAKGVGSAGSAGGAGSAGSAGSLNSSDSADSSEPIDNDTVESSDECRARRPGWGNLWDEDNNISDSRFDNVTYSLLDEVASLFPPNKNFDNAFLMDIQTGLSEIAETKDVDKTQYILDRIAFFAEMKAENPDMSYEEINEKFGQALVYESVVNELYAGYSFIFGADFANSGVELADLADYAIVEADENPLARLMYYETMSLGYLTLASNGELTNQEYLNLRRMDLLKTFPGFLDLGEINRQELYDKICTLNPEEIDKFQQEILSLPSCKDANYSGLLTKFLQDFKNATADQMIYSPKNKDATVSYQEIFESRYGNEFNPDEVIAYKQFEANAQAAVAIDSTRNEILTILDSAKTESSMSEAIFTALFMLTDSTDDKVLTEKLQELTGMQNIQVQNGCVSIIQTQSGSGQQPARARSQDSLTVVVDNLKNGINTNSDASIAVLTQDAPAEPKGFFGKIGDMFGQFSAEYIAPIVDSIGLSEQTLGYIETGAGILAGGLLIASLVCGGWTLVAAGSVVGAISAGAGYAGGLKELNDLYNNGEIELYDENGNWSPDERAQAILDNMETDAALAAVDLLFARIGSVVAGGAKVASGAANFLSSLGVSSAKVGRYTAYAQAGISNGINAAANMTAAGVLTGDGNVGTNIAFAGLGAFMDIKSSNLSNLANNIKARSLNDVTSLFATKGVGKNPNNKGLTTFGVKTLQSFDNIVVDKNKDVKLQEMISEIQEATQNMNLQEKADYLYDYMVKNFGTSRGSDVSKKNSANFPRGKMLGDIFTDPDLIEKTVCRHRALLFKVLADEIGLPTEVHFGQYGNDHTSHVWNFVRIEGSEGYVYDTMIGNSGLGEADTDILSKYHYGSNLDNGFYTSNNNQNNKPTMANGLAVGATVVSALGLTEANAQPIDPPLDDITEEEKSEDDDWNDTNNSLGGNGITDEWGDTNNSFNHGDLLDDWNDINNSSGAEPPTTEDPTTPETPETPDTPITPNIPIEEGETGREQNDTTLEPGTVVESGTMDFPRLTINVENTDGVTGADNGYTPEEQEEIAQTVYEQLFEKYGPNYDYEINVDQWGHVTYNVTYRGNNPTDNSVNNTGGTTNDTRIDDPNNNDWQNPFVNDWNYDDTKDESTGGGTPTVEIGDLTWDWETSDWSDSNNSGG